MLNRSVGLLWDWKCIGGIVLFILLWSMNILLIAAEPLDLVRVAPVNNLASNQELKENYVNFSTKPYGREDLAIRLLIPKDWRDIPVTISTEMLQKATEIFIPLTEQRAPQQEAANALIEVRYSKLDMEIGLDDLVDAFLETFGYEVLMRRQGEYNRRDVDEVLVRAVQDDEKYLARLTFSRHGNRVFLVNGSVKESYIDQYAKILGIAAVSLTVKQKSASEFAQPMTKFSSKGKPGLSFRYPTTLWRIEEPEGYPTGVTVASLSLRVAGETPEVGKTYASIYVKAVEKNETISPNKIFNDLKEVFEKSGFTFRKKILVADIEPQLSTPLGKLERWDVTIDALAAEVTLLLLPKGDTFLGLGLFSMKRQDNIYGWMTAWRVFEIIVADLTGKSRSFSAARKLVMPSDKVLNKMIAETLEDFAIAVNTENFSHFHTKLAQNFQNQTTPKRLQNSFRKFSDKGLDPVFYKQTRSVLTTSPFVQNDGVLKLEGFYPTLPLSTLFRLNYFYEKSAWKLLGIHISLKEAPIESTPQRGTKEAATDSSSANDRTDSDINVLASSNGVRVLFATSQYDSTNWRVKNLIDGKLGNGHGFAMSGKEPGEVVFELPTENTITHFGFNPFTTESPKTWAREVEVLVSTQGPARGFTSASRFTLHNWENIEDKTRPLPDQRFEIKPVKARFIKLRILSNYGGNYIEMGEFKAYSQTK
jgi:F5/8 type C domain